MPAQATNEKDEEEDTGKKLFSDLPPWIKEEVNRMLEVNSEAKNKNLTKQELIKQAQELKQKEAEEACEDEIEQMSTSQFANFFKSQFAQQPKHE